MSKNIRKETNESKYTKQQRNILIACAVIMVTYVVLACIVTYDSFWDFAAVHTVLAAVTIIFLWIGGASKVVTYVALFISLTGAGTALAIILYYLTILGRLANG